MSNTGKTKSSAIANKEKVQEEEEEDEDEKEEEEEEAIANEVGALHSCPCALRNLLPADEIRQNGTREAAERGHGFIKSWWLGGWVGFGRKKG